MPRTTRAAARAAQDDVTATIRLDEDVQAQIAEAVNEFSTQPVAGVLQEQMTPKKANTPSTTKKARSTRKGKKVKDEVDMISIDMIASDEKENNEMTEDHASGYATHETPSKDSPNAAIESPSHVKNAPLAFAPELPVRQPFHKLLDTDSETSDAKTTQSLDENISSVPPAVINLQNMFNHQAEDDEPSNGLQQIITRQTTTSMKASEQMSGNSSGKQAANSSQPLQNPPSKRTPEQHHARGSCDQLKDTQKERKPMVALSGRHSSGKGSSTTPPKIRVTSPTKASAAQEAAVKNAQEASTVKATISKARKSSVIPALNPPPLVAKSTKPLTVSTFRLPGEALTEKFKKQKEERLKRMEEQAEKKAELRAQALARIRSFEVKETATSRARKSNIAEQRAGATCKVASSATRAPPVRARASTLQGRPRGPIISVTDHSTPATANKVRPVSMILKSTSANQSRPRVPLDGPASGQRSVSPKGLAQQKIKGKAVFNRAKAEQKTVEQEIRDKAEAARKARAEAAERGRQASKDWAEKMKARSGKGTSKKLEAAPAAVTLANA